MIARVQHNFQTPSAFRFYQRALWVTIIYSSILFVWHLSMPSDPIMPIFFSIFLATNVICYFMTKKMKYLAYSVFVYAVVQILGFIAVWTLRGGINGPATTYYFTLAILFVVILPETYKLPFVSILCIIMLGLSFYANPELDFSDEKNSMLWIDYIINSIFIAVALVYLKEDMDNERELINEYNNKITDVTFDLEEKKHTLVKQRKEIEELKGSLESIVEKSTFKLNEKNVELSEYAFNNAHILRAPLSNILGLIQLMRPEVHNDPVLKIELEELQKKAIELDDKVNKINTILK